MAKSVLIIGAGIAGLSAGCYAQMNGYVFDCHADGQPFITTGPPTESRAQPVSVENHHAPRGGGHWVRTN